VEAEQMLLEEILRQQKDTARKVDEIKDQISALEGGIISKVEKDFVKKTEFPTMWNNQHRAMCKDNYEKFDRTTNVMTMMVKWGGWIIAAAGVITYWVTVVPK